MVRSDLSLKRWYAKYNRMYFGGELPDAKVWWEPPPAGDYADCDYDNEDRVFKIRMNPSLMGWLAIAQLTLLHEMVHVKLWPRKRHTKIFHAEMLRLATLGAFNELW